MGMRVRISSAALQRITADAAASPDMEICGLLFGEDDLIAHAEPCRNVAPEPSRAFEIDPGRLIAAYRDMRSGGPKLIGCYHSHPLGAPVPSPRDAAAARPDGWLWVIVAGGGIGVYRAVAGGAIHDRFDAVRHEVLPAGCVDDRASPEGAQVKHPGGEPSR